MQDLDEDETIQSLVQLKDLRSFEQQQASGTKIEDKQREKEEEDGETSKTYVPEALAPSSTESVSTLAGAPPNEYDPYPYLDCALRNVANFVRFVDDAVRLVGGFSACVA